jgi:hypothetical protein
MDADGSLIIQSMCGVFAAILELHSLIILQSRRSFLQGLQGWGV